MVEIDPRLQWCADLVEYATRDLCVNRGTAYPQPRDAWVEMRHLRGANRRRMRRNDGNGWIDDPSFAEPQGFGVALFRRAGKNGLIASRNFAADESRRPLWMFTTLKLAEEWNAERDLSDGERAERTATGVRNLYARNVAEYGDRVGLWPAPADRAAIPQDGIQHAIDGGLVIQVQSAGGRRSLVPAECYDTYVDTLATYESRQQQAAERHADLVARVHGFIGGSARDVGHLTSDQMERILELVDIANKEPAQ